MNNSKSLFLWGGLALVIVLALAIGLSLAGSKAPLTGGELTVPVTADDTIIGPATAPVTIVEYSDFQCPACGLYFPLVERLMKEFPNDVRLVYRHFPLPQHANAIAAASAAEAARAQGKFWEMYRLLFTNQDAWADKPADVALRTFRGYASQLGLDLVKFDLDLKNPVVLARINTQKTGGVNAGVDATPTFYLNGQKIANPSSYDNFASLVKAQLSH